MAAYLAAVTFSVQTDGKLSPREAIEGPPAPGICPEPYRQMYGGLSLGRFLAWDAFAEQGFPVETHPLQLHILAA